MRHLGTIYEGLLEYHLEPTKPDGTWTVDLLNDKGERKASGSYYTPDYIVKYIVDQTVGPLLRSAVQTCVTDAEKISAVLDLNIVDPAMGSGHFPVEVTEYIARFLVDLAVTPDTETFGEADILYWKRRVAHSCIYGVDLNPLAVDLAKLSLWFTTVARDRPLSFLDHHLRTGNSLVGARLADVAQTDGGGGTSKRGTRKRVAAVNSDQLSMLDDDAFRASMSGAVSAMSRIEASEAITLADVKHQAEMYAQLRDSLNRRYGRLADLMTATSFGLTIDPALWQPLADYATGKSIAAPAKFNDWLTTAEGLADKHRFFHWELEFPEVYFDQEGQSLGTRAGFDAVVGNPPYVRQEQVAVLKPYLASAHRAVYDGVADLYVYFYHQGLELLRVGGRLSFIVTNKWLRAGYGERLRGYFAGAADIERIVDFGHAPIFEDADTFPSIVVLNRRNKSLQTDGSGQTRVTIFPREALNQYEIASYIDSNNYVVPSQRFDAKPWSLERPEVDALMAKIRDSGVSLRDFIGGKPYRGILTGLNEAFLIDTLTKERLIQEDPSCTDIIKPYFRGQDIKRWIPQWAGLWVIFARRGIDIDAYPSIKQHLLQFRDRLEPRPKDWAGGNWLGRKPGQYQWYELQDSVDYWRLFSQPKILYQEIQFHSWFALETSGTFINNKVFLIPSADLYLLAVLNSPIMWWYNWRYLPHMKDEALTPIGELMISLPIAQPAADIRAECESSVGRLVTLTKQRREAQGDVLDWLRVEFELPTPGQRLEAWSTLDEATFVEEVRSRGSRTAGRLSPGALRTLKETFQQEVPHIRSIQAEEQGLERRIAELIYATYGLTPEEIDLLWQTAPPRMPVGHS